MLDARTHRAARTIVVRRRLAAVDARALARSRLTRRLEEESGAQVAEYAMLGGVSAAACSALMVLLRNQDTMSGIVEAVVSALGTFIGSWF